MIRILTATIVSALTAAAQPLPLGSVQEIDNTCQMEAGPLPHTTCKTVRVSAPGVPDMNAYLRISEPPADVAFKGVVVFGSGGAGNFFSYDKKGPLMPELQKAGYRLVQRAWKDAWSRDAGPLAGAGRQATLLAWVHKNLAKDGAFCATGNSNGAAELGYALARYGLDEILDLAVPSSGPWTARLDLSCTADPAWLAECRKLTSDRGIACEKQGCSVGMSSDFPGVGAACAAARKGDAKGIETLLGMSLLAPGARLSYPKTLVHFFYGGQDCGQTVPMGLKFAAAVTSQKAITVVPTAPHQVYDDPNGSQLILDVILKGCVKRH